MITRLGMAHAWNPRTWGAEAGGWVWWCIHMYTHTYAHTYIFMGLYILGMGKPGWPCFIWVNLVFQPQLHGSLCGAFFFPDSNLYLHELLKDSEIYLQEVVKPPRVCKGCICESKYMLSWVWILLTNFQVWDFILFGIARMWLGEKILDKALSSVLSIKKINKIWGPVR